MRLLTYCQFLRKIFRYFIYFILFFCLFTTITPGLNQERFYYGTLPGSPWERVGTFPVLSA